MLPIFSQSSTCFIFCKIKLNIAGEISWPYEIRWSCPLGSRVSRLQPLRKGKKRLCLLCLILCKLNRWLPLQLSCKPDLRLSFKFSCKNKSRAISLTPMQIGPNLFGFLFKSDLSKSFTKPGIYLSF